MAMMAILMGTSLASCTKNETPGDSSEDNVANEKKLTKIAYTNGELTFSYDSKGRLTEASESAGDNIIHKTFIWGDDAIKVNVARSWTESQDSYMIAIENGLVKNENDETYTYNQSGRLIKIEGGYEEYSILWDGDKLVSTTSVSSPGASSEYTLTYDTSCEKGYYPYLARSIYIADILFVAHPEVGGFRTKQLPSKMVCQDKGDSGVISGITNTTFAYKFDNEGYISKITKIEEYKDNAPITYTYTLTWE